MTASRTKSLVVYLALLATIVGLCVTVVALPVLKLDDTAETSTATAPSDDANEVKRQQAVDLNYMLPTGNVLNIVVDRVPDATSSNGRVKVSLATNSTSGASLIDGIDRLQKQVQDSIGQRDHDHDLIDSRGLSPQIQLVDNTLRIKHNLSEFAEIPSKSIRLLRTKTSFLFLFLSLSTVHGNKIFGRRTDNSDISESTNSTRSPVKISIGSAT
uniref:Uncharacterized protein n=1 Tax=Trichogramma kaykai TaxID=54128 RepID=A0ABD2VT72_9HYME